MEEVGRKQAWGLSGHQYLELSTCLQPHPSVTSEQQDCVWKVKVAAHRACHLRLMPPLTPRTGAWTLVTEVLAVGLTCHWMCERVSCLLHGCCCAVWWGSGIQGCQSSSWLALSVSHSEFPSNLGNNINLGPFLRVQLYSSLKKRPD